MSVTRLVVEVVDGDVDQAIKRLGKRMVKAGVVAALKKRKLAPSTRARQRLKRKIALQRHRRAMKKLAKRTRDEDE